jgi:hypothetical protein
MLLLLDGCAVWYIPSMRGADAGLVDGGQAGLCVVLHTRAVITHIAHVAHISHLADGSTGVVVHTATTRTGHGGGVRVVALVGACGAGSLGIVCIVILHRRVLIPTAGTVSGTLVGCRTERRVATGTGGGQVRDRLRQGLLQAAEAITVDRLRTATTSGVIPVVRSVVSAVTGVCVPAVGWRLLLVRGGVLLRYMGLRAVLLCGSRIVGLLTATAKRSSPSVGSIPDTALVRSGFSCIIVIRGSSAKVSLLLDWSLLLLLLRTSIEPRLRLWLVPANVRILRLKVLQRIH